MPTLTCRVFLFDRTSGGQRARPMATLRPEIDELITSHSTARRTAAFVVAAIGQIACAAGEGRPPSATTATGQAG